MYNSYSYLDSAINSNRYPLRPSIAKKNSSLYYLGIVKFFLNSLYLYDYNK